MCACNMFNGYIPPTLKDKKLSPTEIKRYKLDSKSFLFISAYIDKNFNVSRKKSIISFRDSEDKVKTYKDLRDEIEQVFGFSKLESSAMVHRFIVNRYKHKGKSIFLHW